MDDRKANNIPKQFCAVEIRDAIVMFLQLLNVLVGFL